MILRGILERSLGGFICIRGYAKLSELATLSRLHAGRGLQPRLKRLDTNVSNGVIKPITLQQGHFVEVLTL